MYIYLIEYFVTIKIFRNVGDSKKLALNVIAMYITSSLLSHKNAERYAKKRFRI